MVVISGHDHMGAMHYDYERQLNFLTLEGVVETKRGAPAHYVASINGFTEVTVSRANEETVDFASQRKPVITSISTN